jgi:gliding motility-associated-like protein
VTYDNNSITIQAQGNFEFSLDGIHYGDQPYFGHLPMGEYQIYVRDKSDCGVVVKDAYLLMYPKYFTPNADGYHDFWNIIGSTTDPNMKISIFDRYGKLITSFFGRDLGWDGTYNEKALPSNDYWFVVSRSNGKNYKGHFTLKR